MPFKNASDFASFYEDSLAAYRPTADLVAHRCAQEAAYCEGIQWQVRQPFFTGHTADRARLYPVNDIDRADLRVTDNFVTTLAQRVASLTYPETIDADVLPSLRDTSGSGVLLAQVRQDALLAVIDQSGFVKARRIANWGRTVMGDYGVGFCYEAGESDIGNGPEADCRIRAFAFHPMKLVLDPHQESGELSDHEWVIYRDVWTVKKAKRVFGAALGDIDESKCQTIEQLKSFENKVNRITNGTLFASVRAHAQTKGVVVIQSHHRQGRRFGEMNIMVDTGTGGENSRRWINQENPVSPFGGHGLPLFLYHAHRRDSSPWSISDVRLVIEDQNRQNILASATMRWIARSAHFNMVIDKKWFPGGEDEIRQQLSNRIGGTLIGESDIAGSTKAPTILQYPPPAPILAEMADRERAKAMDKVARPEITAGHLKTHVPDASNQTAIEQANQIGMVRVSEDLETDADAMKVMLGTLVGSLKSQHPSTLGMLTEVGLTGREMMALSGTDPNDMNVRVEVRRSSIQHRSPEARRNELQFAITAKAITPLQYRAALAADLDAPVSGDDGFYVREATRAAYDVLAGEEWIPRPLGEYSSVIIDAFKKATLDKMVKTDPEALSRLQRAIEAQTYMATSEMLAANPELAAQVQQANQPAEAGPGEVPDMATAGIGDVLAAIHGA